MTPAIPTSALAHRNLEFLLLVCVLLSILSGLWLVVQARASAFLTPEGTTFINLNQARKPAEILPALSFLVSPADRSFAASRVLDFLRDREHIDSVAELRSIRIPSSQVQKTRGLSTFPERLKEAQTESIPLFTQGQMQQLRRLVYVRTRQEFDRSLISYSLLFFAGYFLLHAAWRLRRFPGDQILLPAVQLLSGLGFLMMVRLRDPVRDSQLFPDFAVGVFLGCILAFPASVPDYERSGLRRLAYVPLLASFAISVILIVFGSGPGASDAKVNLKLGPILVQPVEVIKVLLILFLAGYFAERWEFLRELRQSPRSLPGFLRGFDLPRLRYAAPLAAAIALAIAFFFLEKDLGPALVLTLLFLFLYAIARARAGGAVLAFAVLVGSFWLGYALKTPRTVANRVAMWLSPWDNFVRPGGDHLAQSFWGLATGGVFGTGLGLGDPASVPAIHTDLILSALGEELGFLGLLAVCAAYIILIQRGIRIALRSRGSYSFFLAFAIILLFGLQAAFITAGILGIVPLSGVVTPFVNYGKSSMIANFLLLGMLSAISATPGNKELQEPFHAPVRWSGWVLAGIAGLLMVQAVRVQAFEADRFLVRGTLVPQSDGHRRYAYNGRILEAARSIPRGTIFDRNGIPLAASSAEVLESFRAQYDPLHVDVDSVIRTGARRLYPFGAVMFHIVGDLRSRLNWGASNSSFVERDQNTILQGYDDRAVVTRVQDKPGGPEHAVVRRDLRELIPLVRYRYRPDETKVREILDRNRDVHLTLDARLQVKVADIFDRHIRDARLQRGGVAVTDPSTGDLLASVTYPREGISRAQAIAVEGDDVAEVPELKDSLLDRPRYGLYPPGSSFKLVTSIAALQARPDAGSVTYECKRLPDGRIGNYVRGWGRPARDDVMDKQPHGNVNLARGLVVSCNAYFAQLGTYVVGAERLLKTADLFGIRTASPNTPAQLKDALPQASYGQGQVLASPLQMARVAGSIANGGQVFPSRWVVDDEVSPSGQSGFSPEQAGILSGLMRRVVTEGTGQTAKSAAVPIAGKTGTAELQDRPSHAWFVGFAPYGAGAKRIAFGIILENGRYGGRVAAPVAADLVGAALDLGLIGR